MAEKRSRAKPSSKPTAAAAPHLDRQVEQIRRVIEVMVASGAVEVELEDEGTKLRVRLKEEPKAVAAVPAAAAPARVEGAGAAEAAPLRPVARGEVFKSPMVGTVYRAAAPDAEPFVKVGDHVGPDSVVCIIEAMKVMNEIKAELEGEVVEVLAQSGEPVDYGQPLFVIKV